MSTGGEDDWDAAEALAEDAAAGNARAARELVAKLWPHWIRLALASRTLRGHASREDAAREVATRLAEKLGRPGSPQLRSFAGWRAEHPDRSFADWVRIVVANTARDLVRGEAGRPRSTDGEPSPKRLLNELAAHVDADEIGVRPPFTAGQTARELLEYASGALPEASRRVLAAWLEGASFAQIAADASLADEEAARKALRAAIAVLRRRFAEEDRDA